MAKYEDGDQVIRELDGCEYTFEFCGDCEILFRPDQGHDCEKNQETLEIRKAAEAQLTGSS